MGRKIRTTLPILPQNLQPAWPDMEQVRINDSFAKTQSANSFNKRKGVRDLPVIINNQPVRIRLLRDKEWSEAERVLAQRGETSYAVQNRKYLQILPEKEESDSSRTSQEGASRPVGESSTCDIHSPCGPPIALPIILI